MFIYHQVLVVRIDFQSFDNWDDFSKLDGTTTFYLTSRDYF